MSILRHLVSTPQQEMARSDQVKNNAGGYVFQVDEWVQLKRFLLLGTEGGTFYQSEGSLTVQNVGIVSQCLKTDGLRTVREIVEVAKNRRAVKSEPAILALALASKTGSQEVRAAANSAVPLVCGTATQLFFYAECVKAFGGWGSGTRKGISSWYLQKDAHRLALQLVKYRSRNGWTHRDMLRKVRPHARSMAADTAKLVDFAVHGTKPEGLESEDAARLAEGFLKAQEPGITPKDVVRLIADYGIPREALPTTALNSPEVWAALLDDQGRGMAVNALVRNLGKMTAVGLLKPLSAESKRVESILTDAERIKASGFHPVRALLGQKVYAAGRGVKGSLTWHPVSSIVDALQDTFTTGFDAVQPTGKRFLIGLDVSGSMCAPVAGTPNLSAREACAAVALTIAKTEKISELMAFSGGFRKLGWTHRSSLRDAVESVSRMDFDSTDCALPILYAEKHGIEVDTFIVLTDSETWVGNIHPFQALKQYRRKTGIAARLLVLAATSSGFTIADPSDPLMLDVAGFSTDVPTVVREFSLL